jgi:hypothetical protein
MILSKISSFVISKEMNHTLCSSNMLSAMLSHNVVLPTQVLAQIVIISPIAAQYSLLSISLNPVGITSIFISHLALLPSFSK